MCSKNLRQCLSNHIINRDINYINFSNVIILKVDKYMKLKMGVLLGFVILTVLFSFYFLLRMPNNNQLPILDHAEPFVLESVNGNIYDSNNNKVKLLAFFYTKCPNICPMTMLDFKDLQGTLKKELLFGNKVELISITLDPEVDDIDTIKNYAEAFEADFKGWKFLRGTTSETKQITSSYHMKYQKLEGDFIAHNTTMFLIDKENRIRGLYDMASESKSIDKQAIMTAITELIKSE